ncbi:MULTISPECIES: type II secretion system protein N [unclassified Novosphingobium]|uniref:type II secretion system protein N n=1 Tax=unclassified Novosphingobium TaxID=2644732 RepID=UPI0025D4E2DA|nr:MULTISPECIES: type II secretion system protein N [unclassified Novosphingobium]HQS69911.1 type II secretion system protein N [Novosphingobium sp.]
MIGRWIFVRDAALEGPGSRWGRLTLAAIVVVGLIVLLPLRLVLGLAAPENVSARSVEGSVWDGRIADLNLGLLPLGTVEAGLEPLPLLIGRAQFSVMREGFSAKAYAGGGVSRANGSLALPDGLGGLPVTAINFTDFSAGFAGGTCMQAEGTLGLTLASLGPLLPDAIMLSGKARCEKGALVVPMRGAQGMEQLTLRLTGDGRWQADLTLSGLSQETADALRAGGFDTRPGGIGIATSGTF